MHRSAWRNVLGAFVLISATLFGAQAWADSKTWNGGSTNWATGNNWTPNGAPGANDCAIIPNLTTKPIIGNNTNPIIGQLQIAAGSSVTINAGQTLTVNGTTNLPAANTLISPVIDGTGSVLGGGLLTVTGGPVNGTLINNSMTLGAFTLNAALGRNMGIPSGVTVTFNGAVNVTQSEIHLGAAAGAASTMTVNGLLTVAANGTLDMRAPGSALNVSGNVTLSGTWMPGTSTVLLNPAANQTVTLSNANYTFYNLTVNTAVATVGNGRQITGWLVTPSNGFKVLNDLTLTRGQFQIGAFTVEVMGNTFSGSDTQSQLDFTGTGLFKAHGNVDLGSLSQISTQVNGPFATIEMAASVPVRAQTFQLHATTNSQYFDLDAFVVTNTGGVTVLDNPNAEFTVNGQLSIGNNCTLVVQDVFDPESPLIMGTASVLRLENIVSPDSTIMGSTFTAGTGTVVYAGLAANPNQIVYAQQNNGTLIPYYNLSIDNALGRVATQQNPLAAPIVAQPLTVAGSFSVVGGNSTFTSNTPNMVVAKDFTVNGTFNHANATVTLNGTGTIAGTTANLVFNNLLVSGVATTDVRTATRNFTANNQFRVTNGSLNTSGTLTMTALTEMLVGDGVGAAGTAALNLSGNATLAMGSGRTFSVSNVDGRFTTSKVAGVSPTLTHDPIVPTNTFLTAIGGQVDLYGLNFSFARYEGLNITSTATVTRLRDVRFTGIFPTIVVNQPPRHLSVAVANLDLDCPGCYFESAAAGYYNVWANGAGIKLRFEDRRSSFVPGTAYNGPGAGEAFDGDDDTNDDGVIANPEVSTALHNGAIVQWVYTANIDMTGTIQGAPMPAFDFNNFGAYYSTYAIMRRPGVDTDTIYVLDSNGDFAYSLPALTPSGSGNIVGPLWWDTEGTTHVVYFGTTTGRVYKFIDTGTSLVQPSSGAWSTHFSSGSLSTVTSWIVDDQTNLYFGGANGATNGIYAVQISSKTLVAGWPVSTTTRSVTTAPSWFPASLGASLYLASNAVTSTSNIYRVLTPTQTVITFSKANVVPIPTFSPALGPPITTVDYCTTNFVAPTNVAFNGNLYVGESNGWMHGLPALGGAGQFILPVSGFPFRDKVSAIAGGATWDIVRGRLFFGNAAGDVYFLGTYNSSWRIGPYNAVSQPNPNYFRFATAGGASIPFAPLYEGGVLYVSNSAGKVFIFDADATVGAAPPAGPSLMRTYSLFSAGTTSDISRDYSTNRIYVANSAGRLYSIDVMSNLAGTLQ